MKSSTSPVVSVGIVHRSAVMGEALAGLLSADPHLKVAGVFSTAIAVLDDPPPAGTIVVYDLQTAHREGTSKLMELHERHPELKLLMLEVTDDDQAIIDCVQAGASGCILQDASTDDVLAAIRSLADGTTPSSPRVITSLFSYVASLQKDEKPAVAPVLTEREEQILRLMAEGLSNREMATRLFLQPQTVKNYVHQVLQKMDMHSRLDVIRRLRSTGR